MKTLDIENISDAKTRISDIKVIGDGDTFQLICKASSADERWMKSCKAMHIPNVGCVIQVTTQQDNNVAEALCFVPGVYIHIDLSGTKSIRRS